MGLVVIGVLLALTCLAMGLSYAHGRSVQRRRDRRRVPTSRRMAARRQFRGFEHALLAERDPSARDQGVGAA